MFVTTQSVSQDRYTSAASMGRARMTKAAYHQTNREPLATEVDQARMAAILAKHSRPKVEVKPLEVGEPPKAKPRLEWEPLAPNARGYYSLCKRYSVCSISIAGHELFEAYKLAGGNAWFHQLAQGLKSFAEAERVAQVDADKAPP